MAIETTSTHSAQIPILLFMILSIAIIITFLLITLTGIIFWVGVGAGSLSFLFWMVLGLKNTANPVWFIIGALTLLLPIGATVLSVMLFFGLSLILGLGSIFVILLLSGIVSYIALKKASLTKNENQLLSIAHLNEAIFLMVLSTVLLMAFLMIAQTPLTFWLGISINSAFFLIGTFIGFLNTPDHRWFLIGTMGLLMLVGTAIGSILLSFDWSFSLLLLMYTLAIVISGILTCIGFFKSSSFNHPAYQYQLLWPIFFMVIGLSVLVISLLAAFSPLPFLTTTSLTIWIGMGSGLVCFLMSTFIGLKGTTHKLYFILSVLGLVILSAILFYMPFLLMSSVSIVSLFLIGIGILIGIAVIVIGIKGLITDTHRLSKATETEYSNKILSNSNSKSAKANAYNNAIKTILDNMLADYLIKNIDGFSPALPPNNDEKTSADDKDEMDDKHEAKKIASLPLNLSIINSGHQNKLFQVDIPDNVLTMIINDKEYKMSHTVIVSDCKGMNIPKNPIEILQKLPVEILSSFCLPCATTMQPESMELEGRRFYTKAQGDIVRLIYEKFQKNSFPYMHYNAGKYMKDSSIYKGEYKIPLSIRIEVCTDMFFQIISYINLLHNYNIVHRDINPANILMSFTDHFTNDEKGKKNDQKNSNLKPIIQIADLDSIRKTDKNGKLLQKDGVYGTAFPSYMYKDNPNRINDHDYNLADLKKVDLYNLGTTLLFIMEQLLGEEILNTTNSNSKIFLTTIQTIINSLLTIQEHTEVALPLENILKEKIFENCKLPEITYKINGQLINPIVPNPNLLLPADIQKIHTKTQQLQQSPIDNEIKGELIELIENARHKENFNCFLDFFDKLQKEIDPDFKNENNSKLHNKRLYTIKSESRVRNSDSYTPLSTNNQLDNLRPDTYVKNISNNNHEFF